MTHETHDFDWLSATFIATFNTTFQRDFHVEHNSRCNATLVVVAMNFKVITVTEESRI
jgi:hypothetical protein